MPLQRFGVYWFDRFINEKRMFFKANRKKTFLKKNSTRDFLNSPPFNSFQANIPLNGLRDWYIFMSQSTRDFERFHYFNVEASFSKNENRF